MDFWIQYLNDPKKKWERRLWKVMRWSYHHVGVVISGIILAIICPPIVDVVYSYKTTPDTVITSAQFDAPDYELDPKNGEWVKIKAIKGNDVNLSGWSLRDSDGYKYVFPLEFILKAKNTVTIHTGIGTDNQTDLFWNRKKPVWNNEGDTATLYDPDSKIISQFTLD